MIRPNCHTKSSRYVCGITFLFMAAIGVSGANDRGARAEATVERHAVARQTCAAGSPARRGWLRHGVLRSRSGCRKTCSTSAHDSALADSGGKQTLPLQPTWQPLFDGKSLDGWKVTNFGGEGEVTVEDGRMLLDFGVTLTGITYEREVPKINYEISLEAMRVDGVDFFCGLTFPVNDSHCSFIVGGWAGAVVGLSSIDGKDASENETTKFMTFKSGQWYKIRVRVTETKIEAWIDDQQIVDQIIAGRTISIRNEVSLSKPLGISAWQTQAALRNIQLRRLAENP